MDTDKAPDRTTVIRITIDRPVGEVDRERLGASHVLDEVEITRSATDAVEYQLRRLVDKMLEAYRR
jgi:hypothetical protein